MPHSVPGPGDIQTSTYIITHVFCPLQLPSRDDRNVSNDHALATAITIAAQLYSDHVNQSDKSLWRTISRMLGNLRDMTRFERLDKAQAISQFSNMDVGDVLALPIRAQNAGVVFRRRKDHTIFEAFELSPKAEDVMAAEGKLICSYPGPAIEIPNLIFNDKNFLSELVNFLAHMNHDVLDAAPPYETAHPRYITELLTGILRGVGRPADIVRISKRVGDDVVCSDDAEFPWRRSALWLLIRVSLETTLDRSPLGRGAYKTFLLFFMCCLAERKTSADLPNGFLQAMSAKISRRLWKLGSSAPDWLSSIVLKTCTTLRSIVEDRWRQVQATQCLSPLWNLSQLDLNQDIRLSLLGCRDHLRNSLGDNSIKPLDVLFEPNHRRRGTLDDFLSYDEDFFEEAYRVEPHITLYDVEQAIEKGIDRWIDRVTVNDAACVKLETLVEQYCSRAVKAYANNPELLSVMLLTVIELWIALDKITIKEIPMLADYSPEVPTYLLENLLLSKTASFRRLRRAQEYLCHRHSQCRNQWSVFSSTTTENSFAVRFYRHSSHLQRLKSRIEEAARREIRRKATELWKKNARCAMHLFCTHDTINVHVWPLPADQLQAEVVIFELDCPVAFNMWRNATFRLLVDICSPSLSVRKRDDPHIKLDGYRPLESYLIRHPRSRITLGSNSMPFVESHRKVHIPAKLKQVCIKDDLKFFVFDSWTSVSVPQALGRADSRGYCTYKLPDGPYHKLQKYVDSTVHTSNEIIANQCDGHQDLSTHEYMAFGHVRSGSLLQWLNILRELRCRSLSFSRPEVHILLAQAVSQVGPLENTGWTWHQEIQEPAFCYALLAELQSLIQDVKANWTEGVTMDTISFLLRRLLASNSDRAFSQEALGLLCTVRNTVFSWVQELLFRIMNTQGTEELRGVLRDTAAICRNTFDVDLAIVPNVLHSGEDIDILLSSAIIIHGHIPNDVSRLSTYSQLLLDRDRRLSLTLESVVANIILADLHDEGINLAVRRIWPDYHPGSKWTPLDAPNSRWFWCTTVPQGNQRSQVVHLNIIDGSFLVDGKPFGIWLPNEFLWHPLYQQVFGQQMLTVTRSDLPGMDYSSRELICGHQVYFSLRNNGSTLVVRAKRREDAGNSGIIELIPHEVLEGDIPSVLIEGHAHWLNLATSKMEIRPLDKLWETSPDNWKIDCIRGGYRMRKGNEFLMDMRSHSWEVVSSLLRPLSAPRDLIVSISPIDPDYPASPPRLSIVLPRYDLSFYVDEDGDLHSHNFRGMVYDENQSVGTLFGLVNRLVLRPKDRNVHSLELIPQYILVPEGDVSCQVDGHHVRIEIATDSSAKKRVTYQAYKTDTDMGCLTGNGSLTSRLFCAYLHALTSGILPDPLTGRSGTEEALSILRSASCWSSARPGSHDVDLLRSIASLCPLRTQPPQKPVQKVDWQDLPANVPNHKLYAVCQAIKEHYKRIRLSQEKSSIRLFERFPSRDGHLLKRSARQAAHLFPSEFSSQSSAADFDVRYPARDTMEATSGEHRAHTAATYVYSRTGMSTKGIWEMVQSWEKDVSGVSRSESSLSLRYDRPWLAPNLPSIWLKIYDLLRKGDERKWHRMLFSLPAMAYASSDLSDLVPVFVAFASCRHFRSEDPPHYDSYSIVEGCDLSMDALYKHVVDCSYPLEHTPKHRAKFSLLHLNNVEYRRFQEYDSRQHSDANATAQKLLRAWPCETPPPSSLDPRLYDVAELDSRLQRHFSYHFPNFQLREHVARVQKILNNLRTRSSPGPVIHIHPYSFQPSQNIPSCVTWSLTPRELFARPAPPLPTQVRLRPHLADVGRISTLPRASDSTPLHQLIAKVGAKAVNPFQHQYTSALHTSADFFENETIESTKPPTAETLVEYYAKCKATCLEALLCIQRRLGPRDRSASEHAFEQSGWWPCITKYILFRFLASNSPIALPSGWVRCLIKFTLLALELQRARRLLRMHLDNLHEELCKEMLNEGCDGWHAEAHPDWLLIQLQGDFLIRRVQANVANEMILPSSGHNTTMQLNMGEGKSSVIVPIVVAVLANGNQLVRVIVPKPLVSQTLHLLTDRLGGLINRRIYYLPFSRSSALDDQHVTSFHRIMLECMQECGVLIVQPDHVLSLKLVSVEKQLSPAENCLVARHLLELQRWLYHHSRDILDESDEVLDPRSQLVFTVGRQQLVEGFPERWTITEQVLGLVSKHGSSLQELFPFGVEYDPGLPGSFPYFRILHAEAGQKLISYVVEDIMEGRLPDVSFGQLHLHSDLCDVIQTFISCGSAAPTSMEAVKECYGRTPLWGGLLLLRGLLANGILLFAIMDRRWRVDYGLSLARTMLAVPYRAKDVPAPKAEFGHPDIAIILTCLSYYYGGLDEEQLRLTFTILFKQHDTSSAAYELWVQACPAVPASLRTIGGVNIESVEQWNKTLFPLFSRNRQTINFYLSNVVFPREAKEFPSKLSSSGWDLVEKKKHVLTGFSGTNDSQYLLPLNITQCDPYHQRGTNAKVLSYLLQQENNHYMCITHKSRRTSQEFLQILTTQKPEIRVLLDVGAQMLDLQNHEVAEAWLNIAQNASAAVYFNQDDEVMVSTRDGVAQPLRLSPFAQQLDRCVVYLDDAHTRGTDIQFPVGFRAAVTLGSKVTKDRLAQGCMRMRKLGHGHSVMFFAPLEVDRRIRSVAEKDKDPLEVIETMDILRWAIGETWENIQRWAPHWVQQGMDHESRCAAWSSFCGESGDRLTPKQLSDKWLQPEAKRLEDLYEPRNLSDPASKASADIRQHCSDIGVLSLSTVGMDEEREREREMELIYEVRRDRQVERPRKTQPAKHLIHQDVVDFVKTGVISTQSIFFRTNSAFRPAFDSLDTTSAATEESFIWSQSVLVTKDFEETVQVSGEKMDGYLRPVQWVLSAKRESGDVLVILSPYEANRLLPDIRSSGKVHLHVYTARVTKFIRSCDDLALYTAPTTPDGWLLPSSFTDQLGMFAGQLYLKDYKAYLRLCRFLCLYTRELQCEKGIVIEADGFIEPKNRTFRIAHTFSHSPLVSLRALVELRNKGTDFTSTHIGKLLHGRLLSPEEFDS